MKQVDLNKSAEKQIILATFQLASEGFNVPSLNPIKKGTDTVYVSCVDQNTSNNYQQ